MMKAGETKWKAVLALFFWGALCLGAEEFRVIGVSDGDTVTVLTADKQQIKIRLAGIDAPESRQSFGNRAKQTLSEKVYGQTVGVAVETVDRYGRTVADLYLADAGSSTSAVQRR